MLKVGINGFGRIGRAIFRINMEKKKFKVVAINDTNPSNQNLAYMLKYDSTYGRLTEEISNDENSIIINGDEQIIVYHNENIAKVPWDQHEVDIVDFMLCELW